MSVRKFEEYKGETVQEIIETYKDVTVITFSKDDGVYHTDYKFYPKEPQFGFRVWQWYEGEYHFRGRVDDIPSISLMKSIEIFNGEGSMNEWETIIIRNIN